jgi:hypothetical protein
VEGGFAERVVQHQGLGYFDRLFCMKNFVSALSLFACATVATAQPVPRDSILRALQTGSHYAATVLLSPEGPSRCDYDWASGQWRDYEPAWHTGQVIWGILEASRVTGDTSAFPAIRRSGNWWKTLEIKVHPTLTGYFRAIHGAEVGELINFTTLADGTPGLFALSRRTGDRSYADVATRAGDWAMQHLYIPEAGLMYDLTNPVTGEILKDRSPHFPKDKKLKINDVARPNTEGFLYADLYRHTGERRYLDFFLRQCDTLVARQSANGFWMDFHPNKAEQGRIHPRFNLWFAESLLVAFELSGDARYRDAALRTARAVQKWPTKDGAIYYTNYTDGRRDAGSICGSAVAFSGIIWLKFKQLGYSEFDRDIDRAARWVLANQFPADHPDPNLRGAFLETWTKVEGGRTRVYVRDIATAFGLRFLAGYF